MKYNPKPKPTRTEVTNYLELIKPTGGKEDGMREYCRPKTRGELRDKLKEGVQCEVASHTASITSILVQGWLGFDNFSVRPSKNRGWSLFTPTERTPNER